MGIFARAAPELWQRGLAPIPCDGKRPRGYYFKHWQRQPHEGLLRDMIERHGHRNIGIVTGKPSGVTVVDVDDPSQIGEAWERFGSTPILIRTPSRGAHLLYCHADERNANLRSEGLAIDVKGQGGFVVAPPSEVAKGRYCLERGSLEDLRNLPPIKPGSLPRTRTPPCLSPQGGDIGIRNDTLFAFALKIVADFYPSDYKGYLASVLMRNAQFTMPLDEAEARKVAHSAWGYADRNRLMLSGHEPTAFLRQSVITALADCPVALLLLAYLQQAHGAERGKVFAISPPAVGKMLNKDKGTIRKARKILIEHGYLEALPWDERTKKQSDGRPRKDPKLFRLL